MATLAAAILSVQALTAEALRVGWMPDQLLVRPHGKWRSTARARLAADSLAAESEIEALGVILIRTPPGRGPILERGLRDSGLFRFVERNYVATVDAVPNDPLYPQQWALPITHVPEAWDTSRGAGIILAIVDTGIDGGHADLSVRVIEGFNAITGSTDATDDNGHGTRMAGIAAATGFNGLGVIGVAPSVQLMPVKSMDASGHGTYADIARGIVYAADHGARVINLSLGGEVESATLSDAVAYAVSRGVVVTAAAGNSGASAPMYPAACPGAIAIGATDAQDMRADFSNFGPWLGLVAPGVGISTTDIGGGYTDSTGTSPATPVVAGTAALVLSANPELTPQQVGSILTLSSDDLGTPGFDPYYGWGRLNAARAVAQAVELADVPDTQPPAVSVTAPGDGAAVQGIVDMAVDARDDVAVARVEYAIDGIAVATTAAPPFSASWDTTMVAAGPHVLNVTAYDASGNQGWAAPLTVVVSGAPATCASTGVSCLPGGGRPRTDCFAEWLVVGTSASEPPKKRKNVVACTDGASCDQDGKVDGVCTFNLGVCFSVSDPRLVDSTGASACLPVQLAQFKVLSPDLRHHRNPIDTANVAALLNAVAALSGAPSEGVCIAGARGLACNHDTDCASDAGMNDGRCALQRASLAGTPGGERCTAVEALHVPLRQGRFGLRPATRSLRVATVTSATSSLPASTDTDSLRLTCLPAN
jgi:subtilisin family serine protease